MSKNKKIKELTFQEPTKKNCTGENMGDIMDLSFLNGCMICRAGIIADDKEHRGKLGIEYVDRDKNKQRVILEFCDLGIWISEKSVKIVDKKLVALKRKLNEFFQSEFCEEYIWEKAIIKEHPLQRSFELTTEDGVTMITFDLGEIKMLPLYVRDLFKTPETRKDVYKIIKSLNEYWFYSYETV